jgi:hypothetical protein
MFWEIGRLTETRILRYPDNIFALTYLTRLFKTSIINLILRLKCRHYLNTPQRGIFLSQHITVTYHFKTFIIYPGFWNKV